MLALMAMKAFVGLAVSPGFGRGAAFVYQGSENLFASGAAAAGLGADAETRRFETAVEAARRELRALHRRLEAEYGASEAHVLGAHFLMLEDPMLVGGIRRRIRTEDRSAEAAVVLTTREIEQRFAETPDPYMRERAVDVHDVGTRLLHHLADRQHHPLAHLTSDTVVVADRLTPSDTAFLDRARVRAIVSERGSEHSHAAILARSMGIPAVTNVRGILAAAQPGDVVVVDGLAGRVILRPESQTGADYEIRMLRYHSIVDRIRGDSTSEPVTRDGESVRLLANIGRPEETGPALALGAAGIGLLRTEFLYLGFDGSCSESEQEAAYRRVLETMGGRPVTIRTLDIGPDKVLPLSEDLPLAHAAIVERGVHHALRHPEIFRPQLRAILRASRVGRARVLLPMVNGVAEIRAVRCLIEELTIELGREGVRVPVSIPLGAMIETPPAVLMIDEIAQETDFLAIGSNDLLQYLFGRQWIGESPAAEGPYEPALLRAMHAVVEAAQRAGRDVTLCGEIAGEPAFTKLLIGLGFRQLSMSPERLPEVRYNVRNIRASRARDLARAALRLRTSEEARELVGSAADPWRELVSGATRFTGSEAAADSGEGAA